MKLLKTVNDYMGNVKSMDIIHRHESRDCLWDMAVQDVNLVVNKYLKKNDYSGYTCRVHYDYYHGNIHTDLSDEGSYIYDLMDD